MGLLQKAVETFDCNREIVGVVREGHEALAPVSHTVTRADIEIVIDEHGKFLSASKLGKEEPKIIIPVTEESSGRTNSPCAHPLCDQLCYLALYGQINEKYDKETAKKIDQNKKKHALYVKQLKEWANSEYTHEKLKPILAYVESGTILEDLTCSSVIKLNEKGLPEKEKLLVRWRIVGLEEQNSACWMDRKLFDAFTEFYKASQEKNKNCFCMIDGKEMTLASQHAKGITSINGNAKLISSNDESGFTFRGRFLNDQQAATVSYEASQKAHNALRWLASEQGVIFGNRTFICWNPEGIQICSATGPFQIEKRILKKPTDYRDELKSTLQGHQSKLKAQSGVVIVAFDAATSGRLSITYYNELQGSDFLDRLYNWDLHCCWFNGKYGIQSPPLFKIVSCAYGVQRIEKNRVILKTDDRVLCQQMQRLVSCRIDQGRIPLDLLKSLVNRASMPQNYDLALWRQIVFTTCSILNKYFYETKEEECMSWELDKIDRSFQFGRLLAAMDRVEADYYWKTGEERQTSAIKAISAFRRSPFKTFEQINRHLETAYIPRVSSRQKRRYERLKQEIMQILSGFPEDDLNRPLEDIYLMGYELQRNAFFNKVDEDKIQEEKEEN